MQRRGESGQPVKGQSANRPKAHHAPTGQELTDRSTEQFDRLERERDQAREQRAATAEIPRVIRASPNDVQPVFETIVRNAVSLWWRPICERVSFRWRATALCRIPQR